MEPRPKPHSAPLAHEHAIAPIQPSEALVSPAYITEAPRKPPEPTKRLEHCPDCGHNIRVLFSVTCPKCGVNVVSAVRRHESNAAARWQVIDHYRRAFVPFILSYLMLAVVLLVFGEPGDIEWFVYRQMFFVPCAVTVYALLCAAWLRFEQPFLVSVMGLMTAIAVSDTAGFIMWWVPVMFANQFVVAIVLMMVATKLLELEYFEGVIVGLILGAIRYIMHLVLAMSF